MTDCILIANDKNTQLCNFDKILQSNGWIEAAKLGSRRIFILALITWNVQLINFNSSSSPFVMSSQNVVDCMLKSRSA